ncbi:hypothetical protein [Zhongshania sp.]|uniref:hypothetical protein n=1 Tax=Zhongshania sp. TaxID=1971902 RepID=UPI003567F1D7
MGESTTEYTLVDEDGDETRVVFLHRSCCCTAPGCVDDEIQIYEDGDEHSYRLQVPRLMTPYIEGLFDGEYHLKKSP